MSRKNKILTDDLQYLNYWVKDRGSQDQKFTIDKWIESKSTEPYWNWVVHQYEELHFDPNKQRKYKSMTMLQFISAISIVVIILIIWITK
jgi:hypothetical protein